MMPVAEESKNDAVDYRQKYRTLKRKFKFLIYENECFQEELRKAQRKLLKVSRDKSFLLDRLLEHEKVESSSSDSEATVSSDSEVEQKGDHLPTKKRKSQPVPSTEAQTVSSSIEGMVTSTTTSTSGDSFASKKKKASRKPPQPKPVSQQARPPEVQDAPPLTQGDGHMTAEEIERHLEAKKSLRDLIPEKTPLTVPAELFSNEPTGPDNESDVPTQGPSPKAGFQAGPDDSKLIIDLPE
ncbi:uncharacterized protein LOC143253320 isoform X1 [Tachypleus tridentatus]|uniref:uncharacterized protein LOC143253320 isoform X1 n=1 Tax=Tachypleus tridentatus TaxID=6853 RepID=UPI003FCFC82E